MFKITKIKLTAWYILILTVITFSFSVFVYSNVTRVTERALQTQRVRLEDRFKNTSLPLNGPGPSFPLFDQETLIEIREKTLLILVIINVIILVSSSALSYFLAGITLKPIEEMLNKQKMFISNASHEIKTPLTVIKTNLEVTLRNKNLTVDEARESLSDAVKEVDTLNLFTNRLLEHSKYQNNAHSYKHELVDINKVLVKTVDKMKKIAEKNNIKIIANLKGSREVEIYGNKEAIEEVFTNLIENAIKYSKTSQKIDVNLIVDNKSVIIKIEDYGIGISENDLPYIFEPFYRADKSRSKGKYNGFGLGLAISKEIIHSHKGDLKVESKFGKGSTFIVSLPLHYRYISETSQDI